MGRRPWFGFGKKASGAGAEWTPASLGSSLKGWWKADAGVRARTAAQFTSANSEFLSLSSLAGRTTLNKMTIVGWFYLDDTMENFDGFVTEGATFAARAFGLYGDSNVLRFIFDGVNHGDLAEPTTGAWFHLAYVFDGEGADNAARLVCYKDGSAEALSFTGTIPVVLTVAAAAFQIGKAWTLTDPYYGGRMQNVAYYEKALSSSEVSALYNAGSGVAYSSLSAAQKVGLVSWWSLTENSGTRADSHGSNTLTDNNTVTSADGKVDYAPAEGDVLWKWTDGGAVGLLPVQVTQANKPTYKVNIQNGLPVVRCDGAGDTLKVASGSLATQPFWGWMVVDDNDAGTRFYFDGGAASKVSLSHTTDLLLNAGSDVGDADTAGAPHLVTFVVDGASSEVFVDGTSLAAGDAGAQEMDGGIAIGADNAGASSLAGDISELAFVDGSPSAADLANLKSYIESRYGLTIA